MAPPGPRAAGRTLGGGRGRSAAAATPRRWVAPVAAMRAAGRAGGDPGAGREPCTGWPGASRALALAAVGEARPQQAPDTLMGLHGHERPLIALAPMTLRAADTAVTAILEALMGQRATVGRAAQRVEALGWPLRMLAWPPPPPRLALEVGEEAGGSLREPCAGRRAGRIPTPLGGWPVGRRAGTARGRRGARPGPGRGSVTGGAPRASRPRLTPQQAPDRGEGHGP